MPELIVFPIVLAMIAWFSIAYFRRRLPDDVAEMFDLPNFPHAPVGLSGVVRKQRQVTRLSSSRYFLMLSNTRFEVSEAIHNSVTEGEQVTLVVKGGAWANHMAYYLGQVQATVVIEFAHGTLDSAHDVSELELQRAELRRPAREFRRVRKVERDLLQKMGVDARGITYETGSLVHWFEDGDTLIPREPIRWIRYDRYTKRNRNYSRQLWVTRIGRLPSDVDPGHHGAQIAWVYEAYTRSLTLPGPISAVHFESRGRSRLGPDPIQGLSLQSIHNTDLGKILITDRINLRIGRIEGLSIWVLEDIDERPMTEDFWRYCQVVARHLLAAENR
jgi:hypothetical protein